MDFSEIISKINSDKRLVPDLMKSEKGNNFRAISESAILDVIEPVLKEAGWYYTIEIKKSDLQIREAYGSKGKKLQFIATIELKVIFEDNKSFIKVFTESVGMGIDDNDKAMGKAYTYALKYALLKLFRLRYGDDSDFEASKPLGVEKPREPSAPEKKAPKGSSKQEKAMTEAQRDYILGMMKDKNVVSKDIIERYNVDPKEDEYIPMKVAREIINALENDDFLPF